MPRKTFTLLPSLQRALKGLGENLRLARLRRNIPATLMAKRAGITRTTLRRIENGDPHCTLGTYAMVLKSLGAENDLLLMARDDVLGRKLQDAQLPVPKVRATRKKNNNKSSETQ